MTEPTLTRKDQLLHAAEQLFSRRGYHATTVREIARELQIEGGSLYSHISSKHDLLYAIVARASAQFRGAAQAVLASGDPAPAQLRALMRRHLAIVAASTARATVYFSEWRHLEPEQQASIKQQRDEYEGAIRQIIRAGVAAGAFAPVDERLASLHILGLLNWTYQWYRPDGAWSAEELADHLYDLAMQGLAPRGPGAHETREEV